MSGQRILVKTLFCLCLIKEMWLWDTKNYKKLIGVSLTHSILKVSSLVKYSMGRIICTDSNIYDDPGGILI
jgi:hypothetical protein